MDLKYSLVIEPTDDPGFFGFYSPDLQGFTGVGSSVEDCITQCELAMEEHVSLLMEHGLPVPMPNPNPVITVLNSERITPAA
jgi:predicted RNase H-like HicB family nuclease